MEELLKQILGEINKINTKLEDHDKQFKNINSKLEQNDKFQEVVVRQFGELNNKLTHIDYQLDKIERHVRQHHDEIELVAIQVRGLQREPSKEDVTEYFAKRKFSLVMEGENK